MDGTINPVKSLIVELKNLVKVTVQLKQYMDLNQGKMVAQLRRAYTNSLRNAKLKERECYPTVGDQVRIRIRLNQN